MPLYTPGYPTYLQQQSEHVLVALTPCVEERRLLVLPNAEHRVCVGMCVGGWAVGDLGWPSAVPTSLAYQARTLRLTVTHPYLGTVTNIILTSL